MAAPPLQLPVVQNWSCHNCGGCCRQHLIEITADERRRILGQNWTAVDGVPADRPATIWFAGPPWKKRYRLAHQPDGACVFLDEKGLCRIHAKFGEAAKPLPCRIYPYALHPAGRKVTVSLRFSCPSVVANRGKPVSGQAEALKRIAREVVPSRGLQMPPPPISRGVRVEWPDFERFIDALSRTLSAAGTPLAVRLMQALFWMRLVEQSKFDAIGGERVGDYLRLVTEAARSEVNGLPDIPVEPSGVGRLHFRQIVAQYARKDTSAAASRGWRRRLRLLAASRRFVRGRGLIPPLQDGFREVPFEQLEVPFGGLSGESESMLARYFRVKIEGLHFCGPAYHDWPLTMGFYSLALMFPVVLWIARWRAASHGRDRLETQDVAAALSTADHHYGYSPVFGGWSARQRLHALTLHEDLERLCAWYSR